MTERDQVIIIVVIIGGLFLPLTILGLNRYHKENRVSA